jgi:hypothetical protein
MLADVLLNKLARLALYQVPAYSFIPFKWDGGRNRGASADVDAAKRRSGAGHGTAILHWPNQDEALPWSADDLGQRRRRAVAVPVSDHSPIKLKHFAR